MLRWPACVWVTPAPTELRVHSISWIHLVRLFIQVQLRRQVTGLMVLPVIPFQLRPRTRRVRFDGPLFGLRPVRRAPVVVLRRTFILLERFPIRRDPTAALGLVSIQISTRLIFGVERMLSPIILLNFGTSVMTTLESRAAVTPDGLRDC